MNLLVKVRGKLIAKAIVIKAIDGVKLKLETAKYCKVQLQNVYCCLNSISILL